jgi:quercetin dioxygenase-like cupin family protein
MELSRPDRSKARPAPNPEYFQGDVLLQPLVGAPGGELELVAVFFAEGARTLPHAHDTDQVLWVVEGPCVIADGSGRRVAGPGECVRLPARQWHWHGAVPGRSACHVSIRRPGPTDW